MLPGLLEGVDRPFGINVGALVNDDLGDNCKGGSLVHEQDKAANVASRRKKKASIRTVRQRTSSSSRATSGEGTLGWLS